jgi:hypothetical protein
MSSESRRAPTWPALLALLALGGCADLERGDRPEADAAPPAMTGDGGAPAVEAGGVSFATVRPLLTSGCQRCHAAGGMAADTKFLLTADAKADYTSVRALVDVAAPAQSRLLAKASGQGHTGGVIYKASSPEYAALLSWIESGAAP